MATKKKTTKVKSKPNSKSNTKSNTKYKDGVFTTLFHDKEKILELFNALEDTNYGSDTEVQIQTLSDVLYHVRKNDLAFSIDNRFIVLTEHQSSICANMAFRFLLYLPRVYEKMLDTKSIYSGTRIELPTPQFYVLYNGTADAPQESIQKLSEAFTVKSEHVTLELEVKIININSAKKHEVLNKSATLTQYSLFVDKVREFLNQNADQDQAIKQAIHWCIEHNILSEFLKANGSEVHNMLFEEYNVEIAIQVAKEETKKETTKKTLENTAIKMLKKGYSIDVIQSITDLPTKRIIELNEQLDLQPVNS